MFLASMYKMHVRPKLEYCVQTWNPVYAGDIDMIEKVQNRFSRLLPHGSILSPQERNRVLGITSHQTRRLRGDLILMYQLIDNNRNMFQRSVDSRTRGHCKKLAVQHSNNNLRNHSFALRHINVWNALPGI